MAAVIRDGDFRQRHAKSITPLSIAFKRFAELGTCSTLAKTLCRDTDGKQQM